MVDSLSMVNVSMRDSYEVLLQSLLQCLSDMCQDAAVLLHNSAVSIFYHHYLCSEMRELAKQSPCQACLKSSISK